MKSKNFFSRRNIKHKETQMGPHRGSLRWIPPRGIKSVPAKDSSEVRENEHEAEVFLTNAPISPFKDTVVTEVLQTYQLPYFRDECYKTPSRKRKAENQRCDNLTRKRHRSRISTGSS